MVNKKPETRTQYRSAVDGRFKTDKYGEAHPTTTVHERVPLPGKGRK